MSSPKVEVGSTVIRKVPSGPRQRSNMVADQVDAEGEVPEDGFREIVTASVERESTGCFSPLDKCSRVRHGEKGVEK